MSDPKSSQIRCYLIADDYRWHVLTDSIEDFAKATNSYLELMANSKKENRYIFKNIFLTRAEYDQIKKNLAYQNGVDKGSSQPKIRHLSIVD